ncbi:hydantoinase/oxoprolinase family protein [Mesorhizobium ciceri]|uniref:hydantoinase/oxoprolinase family protein n=1 Tax=Mesorhizobium TaxID=68287 RepID=UPI0004B7FBA9|nr:hydantoinase/oxoprolinase family protein [Mesorhizobium ciceri]
MWNVGVDVGGTFTDFFAVNAKTGMSVSFKRPSTPETPATAIINGLAELATERGVPQEAINRLCHGTTVATNTLIQRKGAAVALLTTDGFKDLIEIGRQVRPRIYDLQADFPRPVVDRKNRIEVKERVSASGEIMVDLTSEEIDRVAALLEVSSVTACAIGFLFSFKNTDHEKRLAAELRARFPRIPFSVSSEVHPEFREYERISTTVLNAYLQPVMNSYLGELERQVRERIGPIEVNISQSSGGLMSLDRARRFPIRTALSGPAAGIVGATRMARKSGIPDVITLDMGGTSADVALVRNYQFDLAYDRSIEGFPIRLPAIDINAVGAGGGSIAWFDRDGLLKVGPESAGAHPGPACYGLGGIAATVTDANLVLGRLSSHGLLNGAMTLDIQNARRAIEPIAVKLKLSLEAAALGMLNIVCANMVRAVRSVSVERGHDPREFALLPFGGAGPLHAADIAKALGIRKVIVPHAPGILCAAGLIYSDLTEGLVKTAPIKVSASTFADILNLTRSVLEDADKWYESEDVKTEMRRTKIVFDMRCVGQNFEIPVDIQDLETFTADRLRQDFMREHERAYGFANLEEQIEIVNFRVTTRVETNFVEPLVPIAEGPHAPDPIDERLVWFSDAGPSTTKIYDRDTLKPCAIIAGPAIISQFDSTTIVHPGDAANVDMALNIIIEVAS